MTRPLKNRPSCKSCERPMHRNSIARGMTDCRVCRARHRYAKQRDAERFVGQIVGEWLAGINAPARDRESGAGVADSGPQGVSGLEKHHTNSDITLLARA